MTAALARVERLALSAGLLAVTGLAWAYTIRMASAPSCHGSLGSLQPGPWGAAEYGSTFAMWAVMMGGMMLPTVLPATAALAAMTQGRAESRSASVQVTFFVAGYLAVWTGYSSLAALAQWGLHSAALLSPATLSTGPLLGGGLLIAAGAFQWSPWKDACMVKCRSPLGALLAWWRPGPGGALGMGLRYGTYCLGCCWLLMALSFAVGVMNLVWMAAVTALMLMEKAGPWGRTASRVVGVVLAAWGGRLIVAAITA